MRQMRMLGMMQLMSRLETMQRVIEMGWTKE